MRKWFSIISVVVIFLVALIIAGLWQFNRVLTASHLESLHYQIESVNLDRIQFSELSFVYNTGACQQAVQIRNLNVDWSWQKFSPQIAVVTAENIAVNGVPKQTELTVSEEKPSAVFVLPKEWRVPLFFPKQIHVQQLLIRQPCAAGTCNLAGKIDVLSPAREKITFNFVASPGDLIDVQHQLRLDAIYTVENNLPTLDATLTVEQSIDIQLSTHLLQKSELYWLGELKGSGTYLESRWLPYLTAWNVKIASQANELSESNKAKLSVQSDWQLALTPLLNLPATADAAQRKQALSGRWFLDAQIPLPLKILNFGEFSGQTKIDVEIAAGQLNRYTISADINAEQMAIPEAWQALGLQADKIQLNILSKVEDGASLASLPIEFSGATQGAVQTKFGGHIVVDAFTKKVVFDRLALAATIHKFKPNADYEFEHAAVDLHAVGYWQPDSFSFGLSEPSKLSTDATLQSLTLNAKSARIMANQLRVAGKIVQGVIVWPELSIDSDANLSVDKLTHAQLKTNSWRWQGKTKGTLADFDTEGVLSVGSASGGSSLSVNQHARLKASELQIDWKAADIFLLAANPFADTLTIWPPLLSLARGKINASGNLLVNITSNNITSSKTDLQLQDVAGIYDTTLFEGVSTRASIVTLDKTLKLTTDDLKINQVNKGLILGPLLAAGRYESDWASPLNGKLALKYFNGTLLGGSISTPKQDFDFSRSTQSFMLTLKHVNLSTLLQQHPDSELSGSGQLSGTVPIEITSKGISIAKGAVAAESPGGRLKYKSARAAELAKTQPSMKLLTEALSDFHYSVLASEVNYDENGKLLLSVRLQGTNPKLEKGRPINLNVNLEEDMPAMLASIQLSSKVTDIIKNRLQEYLQKKSALKVTP
jgi:hypothetical protein